MQKISMLAGLVLFCIGCVSPTDTTSDIDVQQGYLKRAALLTDFIADHYEPPSMSIVDPEKFYWPKAMARFEKYGIHDSLANAWIEALKERSPFHFTMVGMARLMGRYPQAPALESNRELLLQKVFDRVDSHNPWTSEGTENHINMERTSGYLFAQYALDYPEAFPQAAGKMALMKDWMKRWSSTIYKYGTGEWNSSIYQVYHMAGWFNIFDFAKDEEVRDMARAVLAYYAAETALHHSWGAYGGSEKRGRGASDRHSTSLDYLCWLWFGEDADSVPFTQRGSEYIQSMHAITSTYFPPDAIVGLARKSFAVPASYKNSKPSYLFEEPSYVKQTYFIDESFTLGSAVSPYGGWTGATSQIVNWKLAARSTDGPPVTVSGNGRFHNAWSGSRADPFTQVVQHNNVLIQMTRMPDDANDLVEKVRALVDQWKIDWQRDFTARFPGDPKPNVVNFAGNIAAENRSFVSLPVGLNRAYQNQTVFADLGPVFLAITFLATDHPDESVWFEMDGRNILIDEAAPGQVCGFVVEAVNASEFADLDSFLAGFKAVDRVDLSALADSYMVVYESMNGHQIAARFQPAGCFSEASYDWGFGPREPVVVTFEVDWLQPDWPCGEGYGRIPELYVDGVQVNYNETWPVFSGPNMILDHRVLSVGVEGQTYIVDYSGVAPVFR